MTDDRRLDGRVRANETPVRRLLVRWMLTVLLLLQVLLLVLMI